MQQGSQAFPDATYVVGIDLGTTTSEVACVFSNTGQPSCLQDALGATIIPSVVAIHDDNSKIFVGKSALQAKAGFQTIKDVKRIIGRRMEANELAQIRELFPYHVTTNEDGHAFILLEPTTPQARAQGKFRRVTPQQVSAEILKAMKQMFVTSIGATMDTEIRAVITVPANFLETQRQATKEAAELAGIKVEQLLAEPTAAAIKYLHNVAAKGTFLVFDFGGGTLDVSLVEVDSNKFTVKGTDGDTLLGGRDVDALLYRHFKERMGGRIRFEASPGMDSGQQNKIKTISNRLMDQCKDLKERLSNPKTEQEEIQYSAIDPLFDGCEDAEAITPAEFETIIEPILEKMVAPIQRVLDCAGLTPDKVTAVLLAGGSARIPAVKARLRRFFGNVPIKAHENLDLVVAEGAAILGDSIRKNTTDKFQTTDLNGSTSHNNKNKNKKNNNNNNNNNNPNSNPFTINDVLPSSLGIEVQGGRMSKILNKNEPLPCSTTQCYVTCEDNQQAVRISVYQGESDLVAENKKLTLVLLSNLPMRPKGEVEIDVSFSMDKNGILVVTCENKQSKKQQKTEPLQLIERMSNASLELMKNTPMVTVPGSKYVSRSNVLDELTSIVIQLKSQLDKLMGGELATVRDPWVERYTPLHKFVTQYDGTTVTEALLTDNLSKALQLKLEMSAHSVVERSAVGSVEQLSNRKI